MVAVPWSRTVSSKPTTVQLGGADGELSLHSCVLAGGERATLFCQRPDGAHGGDPRLAIGKVSTEQPSCTISNRITQPMVFSVEGGSVSLNGVLKRKAPKAKAADAAEAPPAKKAKVEAPAAKAAAAAAPPQQQKQQQKPPPQQQQQAKPAQQQQKQAPPPKTADSAPQAGRSLSASKPPSQKEVAAAQAKLLAEQQAKAQAKAKAQAAPGDKAGAMRQLQGGLQYELLKTGAGAKAQPGRQVQVRYEGRLAKNGKRFDKGVIKFKLGRGEVIKGWDVGVSGMLKGEKRRLRIPAPMGYGRQGAPPDIPPNADLVFEVELLGC